MTTTSKNASDKKTSAPKNEKSVASLVDALVEDHPLLDQEDTDLFQQIFGGVATETDATSLIDRIAAKDFAEKVFEEKRYKTMTVEVIKGARQRAFMLANEGEQELQAAEDYLPKVLKLDRMINNSQAGRRALLKELRHRSSYTPPLAPET